MKKEIYFLKEIPDDFLNTFKRDQVTQAIYYLSSSGDLKTKKEAYVETWDQAKKENIIEILRYYLDLNGAVIAMIDKGLLLGFAALNGIKMGADQDYLNLGFIHVSQAYRQQGIGRLLFCEICKIAQEKGGKKLYIGANPSIATIDFYQAMGCKLSFEIIKEIYDHEPLDLQLEYVL